MSFYSTASAKLNDYIIPLLEYLIGNGGREINAVTIADACAAIEKEWTVLKFPFKPTSDEVEKYLTLRLKTEIDSEDSATIISEYHYSNCELYIFFRYFLSICSLDIYGRCETIEGTRRALERGTKALRTGVLIAHIKRLRPWNEYAEVFGGWKKYISFFCNVCGSPWGTSFTNPENPHDEERLEIGRRWKEELKRAFEQD
jgi:hypothetical protein